MWLSLPAEVWRGTLQTPRLVHLLAEVDRTALVAQRVMLRVLDLFSGIGGFSLGLERAGMRTVAFCEIEPYCRAVLRKHWPDVPCFEDVRTLTAADVGTADVICGGFPCQDISVAGRRAGIEGDKSGLWREYARLIGELRPRYVIVENVAALLGRGIERVLGDLASLGYDTEWHCIPASAIDAPHQRDRIWIVAYPNVEGLEGTAGERGEAWARGDNGLRESKPAESGALPDTNSARCLWKWLRRSIADRDSWAIEPDVGRVAHGVPSRVDRIAALGNAVVPQIPEIIGRAIIEAERQRCVV